MRNSGMIYRKDFKMSSMNYAMRLIGMLPEQHVPGLHQYQYLSICSQNGVCIYGNTSVPVPGFIGTVERNGTFQIGTLQILVSNIQQ